MTKFQALFVLWLRHETFENCFWRSLATRYYRRYRKFPDGTYFSMIGNQLDGIKLEEEAFKVLLGDVDPIIVGFDNDLYECDLTYVNANLKRHYEKNQPYSLAR